MKDPSSMYSSVQVIENIGTVPIVQLDPPDTIGDGDGWWICDFPTDYGGPPDESCVTGFTDITTKAGNESPM